MDIFIHNEELPAESKPRLLVPWSDPRKYEHPMDWLFESAEEALNIKEELAPEEDWVLCKMTITPVDLG